MYEILTGKEHVNYSKFFESEVSPADSKDTLWNYLNQDVVQQSDWVEQATTGRRACTINQHVQEQAGSTLAWYGHFKLVNGYIAHPSQVSRTQTPVIPH